MFLPVSSECIICKDNVKQEHICISRTGHTVCMQCVALLKKRRWAIPEVKPKRYYGR